MKVIGSRKLERWQEVYLEQFAEKVPVPFGVVYNTDMFTFQIAIELHSVQSISQDELTDSFIDIIPLVVRKQLESLKAEVERLLRELCFVYEVPTSLVTHDQYTKYHSRGF